MPATRPRPPRFVFPLLLLPLALLAACADDPAGSSSPTPSAAQNGESTDGPADPAPLDDQIAAVRAGEADAIVLRHRSIGDDQLARIAALDDLRRLILGRTTITNEGLAHLAGHRRLEALRLSSDRITDPGLAHLADCPALRHLILFDTPITDDALPHLHPIDSLESLYLLQTGVTDFGITRLREQRPDLHVHW